MDFVKARFNMVEQQVRPWDVLDTRVLDVINEVPREIFTPDQYKNLDLLDKPYSDRHKHHLAMHNRAYDNY